MPSKIVSIALFVAVCSRYSAGGAEVVFCSTDLEWKKAIGESLSGAVAVVVTNSNDSESTVNTRKCLSDAGVEKIIQVYRFTGQCERTYNLLMGWLLDDSALLHHPQYPLTFMILDNDLIKGVVGGYLYEDIRSLVRSLGYANVQRAYPRALKIIKYLDNWQHEIPAEPAVTPAVALAVAGSYGSPMTGPRTPSWLTPQNPPNVRIPDRELQLRLGSVVTRPAAKQQQPPTTTTVLGFPRATGARGRPAATGIRIAEPPVAQRSRGPSASSLLAGRLEPTAEKGKQPVRTPQFGFRPSGSRSSSSSSSSSQAPLNFFRTMDHGAGTSNQQRRDQPN